MRGGWRFNSADGPSMSRADYSKHSSFPGTGSGWRNSLLDILDKVERLPSAIFAAILFGLAWIPARGQWPYAVIPYVFFLSDWALLAALPATGRSFGPAKPPTLMLACLRIPWAFLPFQFLIPAHLIGTLLVVYGFWIEPQQLRVSCQMLRSKKLKSNMPIRILHLSDLHIERITSRERRLIQEVRSISADLIVLTGDYLNLSYIYAQETWEDAREVLRTLSAPFGIYAVTGSPVVDKADIVENLFEDLPIKLVRNETITVDIRGDIINLVGIDCTHKPFVDAPRLQSVLDGQSNRFTLLLYHTPDIAPDAARMAIDLQLSGHTHGGQVCLPFYGALYTSSLYGKRFESGRYQVGDMILYVSRGIGLEGRGSPRVRFLCPPEIVLWELTTA